MQLVTVAIVWSVALAVQSVGQESDQDLAIRLIDQGQFVEAITAAKRILRDDKSDVRGNLALGVAYLRLGKTRRGEKYIRRAERNGAFSVQHRSWLGEQYLAYAKSELDAHRYEPSREAYVAAKREFERALSLDSEHARSQLGAAVAYGAL